jgi:23S rRNA (pseudouridine1915-N3)-methyltransferase
MKIVLLAIGKTVDKQLSAAIDKYVSRIGHYAPFEYKILPDVKNVRGGNPERQKELEGEQFMAQIQPGDRLVLLDERGKELTSRQFAEGIERYMLTLQRNLVFVIGGAYGFSPAMYARADEKLSLSKMTFSHEMVRLFFTEQIYRAFTILRGEPYHHD